MSIQNAINLLDAIDNVPDLRANLYECGDADQIRLFLKESECEFTMDEFEDAVNSLHLRCKEFEDAQYLLSKAEWFRYLMLMNEKTTI